MEAWEKRLREFIALYATIEERWLVDGLDALRAENAALRALLKPFYGLAAEARRMNRCPPDYAEAREWLDRTEDLHACLAALAPAPSGEAKEEKEREP